METRLTGFISSCSAESRDETVRDESLKNMRPLEPKPDPYFHRLGEIRAERRAWLQDVRHKKTRRRKATGTSNA